MITFRNIPPTEVSHLPALAIKYLEQAIKRTPASTSRLDVTLEIAAKGYGNIYLIYDDEILVGATYLLIYDTPQGKVVGIVLLGGKNLKRWRDDYYKFATEFARLINPLRPVIQFIGRDGWGKAYPMCRRIGSIFELKL